MTIKHLILPVFLLLLSLSITDANTAYGQFSGADRYGNAFNMDEKGVPYSNKYWETYPNSNVISLVRKPELRDNQFILRITNPYAVNGCVNVSDYAFNAEYRDIYLDVWLGSSKVDMRDQPQYAHFQCDLRDELPVADVVINREDLLKNQTKTIRLHSGADTTYYSIDLRDNYVRILPEDKGSVLSRRFKPHQIPGRKTSLVYWFYPLGTVMLWVPGMDEKDEAGIERLRAFAQDKGLVPMESVFPAFQSPLTNGQYQYFVDTEGRYTGESDIANGRVIGEMTIEKKIYGLEKDEIVLDKVAVYGKTPGMYE